MFGDNIEEESPNPEKLRENDLTPSIDDVHTSVEGPNDPIIQGESNGPSENFPELPEKRTVIQPQVIVVENTESSTDAILIKAQPSEMMDQCKFMVNRNLIPSQS